jgi:four helix bundle protein
VLGGLEAKRRFAPCSFAALASSLDPACARTRWARSERSNSMLRIYPVVLQCIRELRPVFLVIERKDKDLGRQLRRCAASTGLNIAEGMYSRGRNRASKYHIALGSAREMLACLELAEAFGYIGPVDDAHRAALNRIVGTLVRIVERPG